MATETLPGNSEATDKNSDKQLISSKRSAKELLILRNIEVNSWLVSIQRVPLISTKKPLVLSLLI